MRRKSNKESAQACAIGAITGVGTGICANFIKKDKNAALKYGIGAYFISSAAMLILKGLKNISDSKKAYKNYEKEEKYENKFDKFISGFSTPEVIDFGNEEKNEKYDKLAKQSRMRANKINLISLAIGMTAGIVSGIICFYKKIPDKIDKISTISLITTAASLFIGNIVSIPDKTKKYKEQ